MKSKSVSTHFHIQTTGLRTGTAISKPHEQTEDVLTKDNGLAEIVITTSFFIATRVLANEFSLALKAISDADPIDVSNSQLIN